MLAWVGNHFQIPTVGVAADPVHIPLHLQPLLYQLATALLGTDPGALEAVLASAGFRQVLSSAQKSSRAQVFHRPAEAHATNR
jgi:hypothetical protein